MSELKRVKLRQVKKEKPSVLGSASSQAITFGIIGTVAFGLFGISTPGIAEMLGDAIPDDIVAKGLKELATHASTTFTPENLHTHGLALVPDNYSPAWGIHEYTPSGKSLALLDSETAAKFKSGMKLIYDPSKIATPFNDQLSAANPHADMFREKLNTLFNHDGKSVGHFLVGNYLGQGFGALVGYHTGRIAKAKWEDRYKEEKSKLNPVDRFLV